MTASALRRYDLGWFSGVTGPAQIGLSDREVRRPSSVEVSSAAIDQLRATWLDQAVGEILELSKLEPGWDSYKGVPVGKALAGYAISVLTNLVTGSTPRGSVHPLSGGGLQVEWHRDGNDLEITFYAPYEIEATFTDAAGQEQVVNVQDDVTPLRDLVAQIAE